MGHLPPAQPDLEEECLNYSNTKLKICAFMQAGRNNENLQL